MSRKGKSIAFDNNQKLKQFRQQDEFCDENEPTFMTVTMSTRMNVQFLPVTMMMTKMN